MPLPRDPTLHHLHVCEAYTHPCRHHCCSHCAYAGDDDPGTGIDVDRGIGSDACDRRSENGAVGVICCAVFDPWNVGGRGSVIDGGDGPENVIGGGT